MGTFANNAGKDFDINLSFADFRDEEDFFDVILAAESSDGTIKGLRAHKLILSACSPVLRSLLKEQARLSSSSKMMPVMLYLRSISARGLNHVLDFIYKGTINLAQEELNDFLTVGESLEIPLMERPKPGPIKRASPAPKSVEKSKRARVVLPRVLPMKHKATPPEKEHSIPTEELSLSEIKPEPGSAAPTEDMYEGDDVADAAPKEEIYDGGENDNMEPEDDYQGDGGADPAPDQQQPVDVAEPSDGTPAAVMGDISSFMESNVMSTSGGFVCVPCGKFIKRRFNMRRHAEDKHVKLGISYICPVCKVIRGTKNSLKVHVYTKHPELKGIKFDQCAFLNN